MPVLYPGVLISVVTLMQELFRNFHCVPVVLRGLHVTGSFRMEVTFQQLEILSSLTGEEMVMLTMLELWLTDEYIRLKEIVEINVEEKIIPSDTVKSKDMEYLHIRKTLRITSIGGVVFSVFFINFILNINILGTSMSITKESHIIFV